MLTTPDDIDASASQPGAPAGDFTLQVPMTEGSMGGVSEDDPMAKTESTAVNQLIANVSGRPLNPDSDVDSSWDELTFENPPMAAAAAPEPTREKRSTKPQAAVPPPTPVRRSTTMGRAVSAEGTPAPEPVALESMQSVTQTQPGMGAAAVKLASSPSIAVPAAGPPVAVAESPVHVPAVPGVKPTWLATPAGRAPVSSQMPAVMPNGTIPPPPMTLAPEHLDPQHPFNRDLTAPAAMVNGEDWFLESSQAVPTVEETDIGTQSVRKASRKMPVGLIAGLGSVAVLAAVFVGGYLMFDGSSGGKAASAAPAAEPAKTAPAPAAEPAKTAPAPTTIAANAAAAEPAVEPAAVPEPTPAPAPAPAAPAPAPAPVPAPAPSAELVDVLFLSNPPGANVVLVDDGKTIPIGATPVSASIDASHTYEAVFALEGHQTRIEKLDPKRDRKFSIDLRSGKATIAKAADAEPAPAPAPAAVAKTEPTPAPKAEPKAKAEPKRESRRSKKVAAADPPKAEAKKAADPAASGGGSGVLMVAAKPPCEIYIDGKPTGLVTPQRSIDLPAGTHKVTLVNKDAKIKKTIAIKITAGKPTKLIQDYTSELP
jgi:hypothetical protein